MSKNKTLKNVLESFRNGEISVDEAEEKIGGIRLDMIGECAKIDTGRNVRCGIPEVVLAENKDLNHLLAISEKITAASGRCIASRVTPVQAESLSEFCEKNGFSYYYNSEGRIFVVSRVPPP